MVEVIVRVLVVILDQSSRQRQERDCSRLKPDVTCAHARACCPFGRKLPSCPSVCETLSEVWPMMPLAGFLARAHYRQNCLAHGLQVIPAVVAEPIDEK